MKLYLLGGEIPSHRKILNEAGVDIGLSYVGLRRKVKFAKPWNISEKFNPESSIFLDAGAYSVNSNSDGYTIRDIREIADGYRKFLADQAPFVDLFSEFDALALGKEWIEEQREWYSSLAPEKFLPIWHPEWGVDYLLNMAERYENLGIPTTSLHGRNLEPVLNRLAGQGKHLHGVAMTHVDLMYSINWSSVSSTSWISPQQFGETIVWTGKELKRYPVKYKAQARKRHAALFDREGFDVEKINADDPTEVLRLSVWSWTKLVEHINERANRVTHLVKQEEGGFAHPSQLIVTHPPVEAENGQVTVADPEQPLSAALEPANPYEMPSKVTTATEFHGVQDALIAMQIERVLFMREQEKAEGGYADPNTSSEMDRLQKMLKTKSSLDQETLSITMRARGNAANDGRPGMLERIFGERISARPEPPHMIESAVIEHEDIADAEIVRDEGE